MFEDDFLEAQYEDLNGGNDIYEYDPRDFYESWNADEIDPDFLPIFGDLDEMDMVDM